jgi:hypothetical protein
VLVPSDADNRALISQLILRLSGVLELVTTVTCPDEPEITDQPAAAGVYDEKGRRHENQGGEKCSDGDTL